MTTFHRCCCLVMFGVDVAADLCTASLWMRVLLALGVVIYTWKPFYVFPAAYMWYDNSVSLPTNHQCCCFISGMKLLPEPVPCGLQWHRARRIFLLKTRFVCTCPNKCIAIMLSDFPQSTPRLAYRFFLGADVAQCPVAVCVVLRARADPLGRCAVFLTAFRLCSLCPVLALAGGALGRTRALRWKMTCKPVMTACIVSAS